MDLQNAQKATEAAQDELATLRSKLHDRDQELSGVRGRLGSAERRIESLGRDLAACDRDRDGLTQALRETALERDDARSEQHRLQAIVDKRQERRWYWPFGG